MFPRNSFSLIFLFFFPILLFSQSNRYSVSSSKDNLSYQWNGLFLYKTTQPKWLLNVLLNANSRTFNQSQTVSTSVDEINGKIQLSRSFSQKFSFNSQLTIKKYSNQNVHLNYHKTLNENFLTFTPSVNIAVSPVVGALYEDKYNSFETGLVYGWNSRFHSNPQPVSTLSGSNTSRFFNFRNRHNTQHLLSLSYISQFTNNTKDSLYAAYTYQNHTEYINENLDVEDIRISHIQIGNSFKLPLSSHIFFTNLSEFRRRNFQQARDDRDNYRLENQIANTASISLRTSQVNWKFRLLNLYQINDFKDRNSSTLLDNNSIHFAVDQIFSYRFHQRSQLGFKTSFSKLEYSTPDSVDNHDDRDEFRFTTDIFWLFNLSSNSLFELHTGARRFHQIYIEKEKSALNKTERELYLYSHYQLKRGRFANSFSTGINAYYLNYDFEKVLNTVGNIANRQIFMADTISWRFSEITEANLSLRYLMEEIGNLDWKKFVEQVIRKNYYNYYVLFLKHTLQNGLLFSEGFSYITRRDYNMVPKQNKVRDYYNKIFWFEAKYKLSKQSFLNGRLSKYIYSNTGDSPSSYFKGNLEVLWLF